MARVGSSIVLMIATAASAAGTEARTVNPGPFCLELRRIVHATGERPPFTSLASAPATLPGFGDTCREENDTYGPLFACTLTSTSPDQWQRLATDTARCLPHALRRPDEPGLRVAQFRLATAAIHISQLSVPGDSPGVDLSYTVYPIPIH